MMQFETMSQAEALEIVQNEASSMGLGILETLQLFKVAPHEFGSVERCAFNTALRGFQRLLQPAESN
jgi:hypothetical protein